MKYGKGLDCGTHMFVASTAQTDDSIQYTDQIDAFFTMDSSDESLYLLETLGVPFINKKGKISVIGEDARKFANMFRAETRRPLEKGCLSKKDMDAIGILQSIIGATLDKPSKPNEVLKYSVTSTPLGTEMNFEYHKSQLEALFRGLGYDPEAIQEARAIALAELAQERFTGLCISCLVPGTEVLVNGGLKKIEEVIEGDSLLDKDGNWISCITPTSREYTGKVYKINHQGVSDIDLLNPWFTHNHELWIKRNGKWQYLSAENIIQGDIVGEKIPSRFVDQKTYISTYHNVTTKKFFAEKEMHINSQRISRFIGYFLGDGHIQTDEKRIRIDFGIHEEKNILDLQDIVENTFHKEFRTYISEQRVRCDIVYPGLAKWLEKYCYTEDGKKKLPWNIQYLNDNQLLGLIQGIIRSDGWEQETSFAMENTSPYVAIALRQAFAMLGIPSIINVRLNREHEFEGRMIACAKVYTITASQLMSYYGFKHFFDLDSDAKLSKRVWIEDGFICSTVSDIIERDYAGLVYDVVMPEEHSFTCLGKTVHNCGAGTTTVWLGRFGMDNPNLQFSIDQGGDWIDGNASDMFAGLTKTKVQTVKEKGFDIKEPNKGLNLDQLDGQDLLEARAREALSAYYKAYIKNIIKALQYKFQNESLPEFDEPISVVISGGTSCAGSFLSIFKEELSKVDLGFKIKDIRQATDPKHTVAKGCLVAAQLEERKRAK